MTLFSELELLENFSHLVVQFGTLESYFNYFSKTKEPLSFTLQLVQAIRAF